MRTSFCFSVLTFVVLASLSTLDVCAQSSTQLMIKGTVYDRSQRITLPSVTVISTSGPQTLTDSLGNYKIIVDEKDSIYFSYLNKRSPWFAIKDIQNPWSFDISLRVDAPELPEVYVTKQSYHADSMENRQEYAKIFNYRNPTFGTSIDPNGGGVGLDLDALINMFRFGYNKRQTGYKHFFEWEEHEKYIDHRFNNLLITRLTGYTGDKLAAFVKQYRPVYEFVENISDADLGTYIEKCKVDNESGHPSTAAVMMNTYRQR